MCWTAAASLALGAGGLGTAALLHKNGEKPGFTIPLAYFSVMELLQFMSYMSIDECALTANTTFTILSYLHIAFQPIFVNMFFMNRLPKPLSKRTKWWSYAAASVITLILLVKLIPFAPESICTAGQTVCGTQMCTVSGAWHLAWQIPYYNWPFPGDGILYYFVGAFLVPFLYGARLNVVLGILAGPVLAYLLTSGNPNEWPSVWCLFSVGILLSLVAYKFWGQKK